MGLNVGIVGATGVVGDAMRRILAERRFPVKIMRFFASSRSAGSRLSWGGREIAVEDAAVANPALSLEARADHHWKDLQHPETQPR